jgi:hypothetical protein
MRAVIRDSIDPPWTSMAPVQLGPVPAHQPTADAFVTVERDGRPVMRIDVYRADLDSSPFRQAVVWRGFVVVGFGESVHFVPLSGELPRTVPLEGYFGALYPRQDYLLVASQYRLFCFDTDGRLRWTSAELGIDGVVVKQVKGDLVIVGEGEWDPPGGWKPFAVDARTGMNL